jgi:hypothetical protein
MRNVEFKGTGKQQGTDGRGQRQKLGRAEGRRMRRFESRKIRSCEVEGVESWEAMEFGIGNSASGP